MKVAEAKSLGLKTYNTGKPCVKGHFSERSVFNAKCLACVSEQNKARYTVNRESEICRSRKNYHLDPEKYRSLARDWYKKNSAKVAEYRRKNSKYYASKCAERRSLQLKRTPKWSEVEEIREFYLNCPKGYHVDHIIPLKGANVSGLHVIGNLQYLTKEENLRKSNYYSSE